MFAAVPEKVDPMQSRQMLCDKWKVSVEQKIQSQQQQHQQICGMVWHLIAKLKGSRNLRKRKSTSQRDNVITIFQKGNLKLQVLTATNWLHLFWVICFPFQFRHKVFKIVQTGTCCWCVVQALQVKPIFKFQIL